MVALLEKFDWVFWFFINACLEKVLKVFVIVSIIMIKIITIITALKTSLKYAELMLLKHFRADALFETVINGKSVYFLKFAKTNLGSIIQIQIKSMCICSRVFVILSLDFCLNYDTKPNTHSQNRFELLHCT